MTVRKGVDKVFKSASCKLFAFQIFYCKTLNLLVVEVYNAMLIISFILKEICVKHLFTSKFLYFCKSNGTHKIADNALQNLSSI